MGAYRYRAITPTGTLVSGVIEAASQAAVVGRLREMGHYTVSAAPAKSTWVSAISSHFPARERGSYRRLRIATQELAALLQAGLDLDRALAILERLGDLGPLQKSFVSVRTHVREGASLGEALSAEPVFPKFFVSTVRAAESGSSLELTLHRMADYLARTVAVREAIASALVYPVILLCTGGLSVFFILMFVLPEFRTLFAEAGRSLPWPTRALMAVGDFVRGFWWGILALAGILVVAARAALRRPDVRTSLDRALLRIPILGDLLLALDVERFSRTLGTLLSNGVALPSALPLAQEVVGNRLVARAIATSAAGLREGDGFADRLERTGLFPAVTVDLIRVGEETGKLDEMLLRQSDLDEQRIRHTVDRLLAILVPALTVIFGLMVGTLIASLLSAILGVNDLALPQ